MMDQHYQMPGAYSDQVPLNASIRSDFSAGPPAQIQGFSLLVRNLLTWVPERRRLWRETLPAKEIIKGVTCDFPAGQMTAIIGPSGSGKTTVMNFLAERQDESQQFRNHAEYYLNGQAVRGVSEFKNLIGYVLQEDLMESELTPRQTFEFYAKMRRKQNAAQVAQSIIDQLELGKCADTVIGDSFKRGISGGEKKRVNIGIELVSDPNLLFLDEPTTGLDSLTALEVIQTLHRLRATGMTIVTVIHSPSSEIMALFDKVVVVCQGQLIFDGPPAGIAQRLARFGFAVPMYVSPVEQLVKLIDKEETRVQLEREQRQASPEEVDRTHAALIGGLVDCQTRETCARLAGPVPPSGLSLEELRALARSKNRPPAAPGQFWLLIKLLTWLFYADYKALILKTLLFLILCAFYVLVYLHLGDRTTYQGVQARAGLIFMLCTFFFMMGVNAVVALFIERKRIYKKDCQKRMYWPSVFYLANQLYQIPFYFVVFVVVLVMVYFSIDLNKATPAATFFWYLYFFFVGGFLGGSSLAIVISVLVNSLQEVSSINPVIVLPATIIAGFFANVKHILEPLRTLSYLSPVRYMFQGCILTEFGDDFNNVFYSFYESKKWINALALVGLVVGYRLFFYFFFIYTLRERKIRYGENDELYAKYIPPPLRAPGREGAAPALPAPPPPLAPAPQSQQLFQSGYSGGPIHVVQPE